MVDEVRDNGKRSSSTDYLVKAVEAKGNKNVTAIQVATDQGWCGHRICLEATLLNWLAGLHSLPNLVAGPK